MNYPFISSHVTHGSPLTFHQLWNTISIYVHNQLMYVLGETVIWRLFHIDFLHRVLCAGRA